MNAVCSSAGADVTHVIVIDCHSCYCHTLSMLLLITNTLLVLAYPIPTFSIPLFFLI